MSTDQMSKPASEPTVEVLERIATALESIDDVSVIIDKMNDLEVSLERIADAIGRVCDAIYSAGSSGGR